MPESRSEAFHLATNMSAKPNAQGTLFSANPSQRTPESRQPRGYSPERLDAVRSTISEYPRTGKERFGQDQMTRTVARSTVPLSDIQAKDVSLIMHSSNAQSTVGVPAGAAGVYHAADKANPDKALISVLPKYAHTFVPIHEIGHHVDRASPYHTPHEKGRAEGFADRYADEHAKKPGYKSRPATTVPRSSKNFGVWTQGMSTGMAGAFEGSYNKARTPPRAPLNPQQFPSRNATAPLF